MALKISTGLRNKMLDNNSLKTTLAGGFLKLYSGTVPADADAAISGGNTLLCTVSVNSTGTGLTFATSASNGTIVKNASEVWSGINAASGTATFYRHVTASDTGVLSTTEARIQGTIGLAGTDMVLSNTTLASGATQTVDYYAVNMPAME
jgi:UDP-N-acetylglucosamine enolpyruvyl transferase